MRALDLNALDPRSSADLAEAVRRANRYWAEKDEPKTLEIVPGSRTCLRFRLRGRSFEVRFGIEGTLLGLARLFLEPAALSWRRLVRFADAREAADASLCASARNALFVAPGGSRRSVAGMCALLVHELEHTAQRAEEYFRGMPAVHRKV